MHRYTCIGCPLGCRLEVEVRGGEIVAVRGFSCRRGREFAVQEHTDPRRIVTTTVRVRGGVLPRLPVRTRVPFPKDRVRELCAVLHELTVDAPVALGDVVMENALGTGVAVAATRDVAQAAPPPRSCGGRSSRGAPALHPGKSAGADA